jgi:ribA/ribD-fused uncharacterized protein
MIVAFSGKYQFLSNFYLAPVSTQDLLFPSVEHAFQFSKIVKPTKEEINFFTSPGTHPANAKHRGKTVELRPDWEEVKIEVMTALVKDKFLPTKGLADWLVKTAPEKLIHGNSHGDVFWGMTFSSYKNMMVGENHLGKILMGVRTDLIKSYCSERVP